MTSSAADYPVSSSQARHELCQLWWVLEVGALQHTDSRVLDGQGAPSGTPIVALARDCRALAPYTPSRQVLAVHRRLHATIGLLADNPYLTRSLAEVLDEVEPHLHPPSVCRAPVFVGSLKNAAVALLRGDLDRCLGAITTQILYVDSAAPRPESLSGRVTRSSVGIV